MKQFRVGIIGCGNIFPMHAVSVSKQTHAVLVAVCDNKEDRAKRASEQFGCHYFTDYKAMIETENLDCIHLCTPHHVHAEMAIYAMEHGLHVVTEKPMAISIEDAQRMKEVSEKTQKQLVVSFQNRFNPGSMLLKETVESGTLGKILSARCQVTWNRSDEYYSRSDWKGTWEKEGGGVVIDQAIHTLDLMHWLIDSKVTDVAVTMGNRAHALIAVDDYAEGLIQYENGTRANFYAMNYFTYDAPVQLELHCEQGIATLIGERAHIKWNNGREAIADRNPLETFDFGDVKQYWGVGHMKEITHVYECLAQGTTPRNTVHEIFSTQQLVCDIYRLGREQFHDTRDRAINK